MEVEVEAEVEGEEEEEAVEVGNAAGVEEVVRLTAADLKADTELVDVVDAVVEAVDMDAFASALRGSFARGGRGGRGASTRFRSTRSDELAAFF